MNLGILGSTGSIGTQALMVAENLPDVRIVSLSASSNIERLEQQIRKFRPRVAAVKDEAKALELKSRISDLDTAVLSGDDGILEAACYDETDLLLTSVVGIAGLLPTYHAVSNGISIALANKETMVTAGGIIMDLARRKNVPILPVDSEHCAVFQCLESAHGQEVEKLLITASGGPFFGKKRGALQDVTIQQALNHPNWAMGQKITIDSATLMNKGFEMIEAHYLFDVPMEKIDVLVHRESVIHSMVQFVDGSVLAQMASPDMRVPIQYAITYPHRKPLDTKRLDFTTFGSLTFQQPDEDTFECLALSKWAQKQGGTMPAVLNAANEVAVELFLNGMISFLEIGALVRETMYQHRLVINPTIEDILKEDKKARMAARELAGIA